MYWMYLSAMFDKLVVKFSLCLKQNGKMIQIYLLNKVDFLEISQRKIFLDISTADAGYKNP